MARTRKQKELIRAVYSGVRAHFAREEAMKTKGIKFPPIDYKALAHDIEMGRLEEKGIDTGYFKRARYQGAAIPKEVREARKKAGLNRQGFADALGVSKKTIEAWEIGARNPDGLATKVLCRILVRPAILKELAQTH